ncbi:hypothetical protein MMC26_000325 [Xylographa opegraphella]|nr:hypothetical protein [Xylographa opegraphella]
MAETSRISPSENTALVPYEDAIFNIVRFLGGHDSGPAAAVISVVAVSPFVKEEDSICTIPLYRYGPAEQIGKFKSMERSISCSYFATLDFSKIYIQSPRHEAMRQKRILQQPVDIRRVKGENDFTAYVIAHADGENGDVKSYTDPEDLSGEELVFLLHGLAGDPESNEPVYTARGTRRSF